MAAKAHQPVLDLLNRAWVSRADMAIVLGYTTRTIDYLRERFGYAFEAKDKNLVYIYAPRWLTLWHDYYAVHGRHEESQGRMK